MQQNSFNWKLFCFIIGNIVLIGTTWVVSFYTPSLIWEIDDLDDQATLIENQMWDKQELLRDYELWDSKYLNIHNTLLLLQSLKQENTAQFKELTDDSKEAKLFSIKKLAEACDVKFLSQFIPSLNKMNIDQLEKERQHLLRDNPDIINNLRKEKQRLDDLSSDMVSQVSLTNFITAIFQTLALAILTFSEILYRRE